MEAEFFRFPSDNASHRLILLHGWGADAEDLLPLGKILLKNCDKEVELLSLNAPKKNPQGIGRKWYELFPADWIEAQEAIDELQNRLKNHCSKGIPIEKTILLGFSQGGAMAIASGSKLPFAGLIGCSAYPHPDFVPNPPTPPIFLIHGKQDNVVPVDAAEKLLKIFHQIGTDIELKTFDGGHEIPQDLHNELLAFLQNCLS